jgi:putative mycofactocin binding protein MftB
MLLTVVSELATASSARSACIAAGVVTAEMPSYRSALATLATSQMIREKSNQ